MKNATEMRARSVNSQNIDEILKDVEKTIESVADKGRTYATYNTPPAVSYDIQKRLSKAGYDVRVTNSNPEYVTLRITW